MLMIHTVLRATLRDAVRLVRGVADGDRERASVIADHVLEVAGGLHNHHHGEDLLLWDRLEERAPSCADHVGQMREQHTRIAERLAVAEEIAPAWRESATAADRDRLAAALDATVQVFEAHTGQEETDILPIAGTVFTQPEWDELGEHGRKSIPRERMMIQLGTILDSSGPYREVFWKELPPPVRLLYRLFGKRQYERHKALIEGTAA
jgi:hemerythrin-like domain-containing protein